MTYAILGAVIGSALLPAALGGLIGLAGAVELPLGVAVCAIASLGMVGVVSLRLRSAEPQGSGRGDRDGDPDDGVPFWRAASAGKPAVTWPKMSYFRATLLLSPRLMKNWLPILAGFVPYIATAPNR